MKQIRYPLAAAIAFLTTFSPLLADDFEVTVGKQEILLPVGTHGLSHFPDQPISLLRRSPLTLLASVGNETVLLSGANWRSLRPLAKVLTVGQKGTFDSGYAGVGGVYQDGNTTYAFYHAELQENLRSDYSEKNGQLPFVGSVGLAVSRDGCRTFQKLGQVLTTKHPRKENAECAGLGDICICLDKSGTHLLAYYTDYSRAINQGVQTALARAPVKDKGKPGSWEKYHQGEFNQPGLAGDETHVLSGHARGADAYSPSVVYAKNFEKYLMVFCAVAYAEVQAGKEAAQPKQSGIYLSLSDDGIRWEEPRQLFASHALLRAGQRCVVHPTLVIESTTKTQARCQLVYAFTDEWPKTPHHLAGRSVTISRKPAPAK